MATAAMVMVRKVWKSDKTWSLMPLEEAVRKLYFADAFDSRDEARGELLAGRKAETYFATYELVRGS